MLAIAKVITLFLTFHLSILPVILADGTKTQTNLHFYFHDLPGGSNPTAIRVAAASVTSTSPTGFGATVMMDDPLTAGPDVSSALVGRAQGLYALASRDEGGHVLMAMNLVFMDQENNGSTLAVLGRNNVFDPIREMPVIGGSGKFRPINYDIMHGISLTVEIKSDGPDLKTTREDLFPSDPLLFELCAQRVHVKTTEVGPMIQTATCRLMIVRMWD